MQFWIWNKTTNKFQIIIYKIHLLNSYFEIYHQNRLPTTQPITHKHFHTVQLIFNILLCIGRTGIEITSIYISRTHKPKSIWFINRYLGCHQQNAIFVNSIRRPFFFSRSLFPSSAHIHSIIYEHSDSIECLLFKTQNRMMPFIIILNSENRFFYVNVYICCLCIGFGLGHAQCTVFGNII